MNKESFEKDYRKLDIFAFSVSLSIHILFLAIIHFKGTVFKTSEFEVINFNAFSLDTEIDSNLISLKSNQGKSTTVSGGNYKVEIPRGMKIKKNSKGETKNTIIPNRSTKKGTTKISPIVKTGRRNSAGSQRINNPAMGNIKYSLSISDSVGKDGKSNFSDLKVKGSPVAKYALKVKEKIMANWKNPYTGSKKSEKLKIELSFTLNKKGKMTSFNIEKLSKDSLFNDSAINAIYSSSPFPPFPNEIKKLNDLTLKVKFEVK